MLVIVKNSPLWGLNLERDFVKKVAPRNGFCFFPRGGEGVGLHGEGYFGITPCTTFPKNNRFPHIKIENDFRCSF